MNDETNTALGDLARAARILAANGHEDMTLGHVAFRDPEGRGIWMKRRGIALGEISHPSDFLLVDWNGSVLEGDGQRHGEWPIHSEAMRARPDIQVSLHSHPEYGTLLSATDIEITRLAQDGLRLGALPLARFERTADLLKTRAQGGELAAALANASVIIMRNHGVAIFSGDVPRLALLGIFFERAARAFIRARAAGLEPSEPLPEDAKMVMDSLNAPSFVADNWAFLNRELDAREKVLSPANR